MAENVSFGVSLEDHVSGPAHKAADAIDHLSNELTKISASFEKTTKKFTELGNALGHTGGQSKEIQTIKDPADIARHALDGLSNGLKNFAGALKSGDAKGAVQGFTDSLASAATALDMIEPGLGQVVSAIIKVGGAFAAVTAGVVQWGIETALEVNAVNASLEALFETFGEGAGAGKKTLDMLDDVAKDLPQSREELAKWTSEIQKMGVTDLSQIKHQLLATASAQALHITGYEKLAKKIHMAMEGSNKLKLSEQKLGAAIGPAMSAAVAQKLGLTLTQLEAKLKAGTVNATEFGNALDEALIEKGAGPLDKMWLKTGTIVAKIKESFRELFGSIDTKPITDAMRVFLSLFEKGKPSAEGMRATITDVFNDIAKVIGWAITEGTVKFLELEVAVLEVKIAVQPLTTAVKELIAAFDALPSDDDASGWQATLMGIKLAAEGLAVVLQPIIDGLKLVNALSHIGESKPIGFVSLDRAAPVADAKATGVDMGKGLVNGMDSMTGNVRAAGQKLGEAAADGVKVGAGAHSPSVKAMEIGDYISQGLAIGMVQSSAPSDAGRQVSTNALGSMLGQSVTSPPANQNGGGGVNISGLVININAPHGVTDAAGLSASSLVLAIEKFQLASGR
jgi:hypothetical protein